MESESQPLLKDSEMAEEDGDAPKTKQCAHNLWVDKYAPRHYTHLLSDDVSIVVYIITGFIAEKSIKVIICIIFHRV